MGQVLVDQLISVRGRDPLPQIEGARRQDNKKSTGRAFHSIQVLRAVAALFVVSFHVAPSFVVGAAGVDIFFIISGFIMGVVANSETPAAFITNRLIRIIPLYWTMTIIYLVGSFVPGLSKSAFVSGPAIFASLLFLPYFDLAGRIAPVLVAGWTLNFEMLFYLIFAGALYTTFPRSTAACAILVLTAIGCVASPVAAVLLTWTAPIMFEFVFGMVLSALYTKLSKNVGVGALMLGLLGFGCAQWFQIGGDGWGLSRVILWGLPAALIVTSALAFENNGLWPSALRPVEVVGNASYSLYLLHGVVSSVTYKVFPSGILADGIIIVGSVAVALLSFHLFEKPVTKALRGLAWGGTGVRRDA